MRGLKIFICGAFIVKVVIMLFDQVGFLWSRLYFQNKRGVLHFLRSRRYGAFWWLVGQNFWDRSLFYDKGDFLWSRSSSLSRSRLFTTAHFSIFRWALFEGRPRTLFQYLRYIFLYLGNTFMITGALFHHRWPLF